MFKKKLQRMLGVLLAVTLMGTVALTGCGKDDGDAEKGRSDANAGKEEGKPTVTLMIDITGFPPLNAATQKVLDKFPEYNIVSKQWPAENLKQTIKTTFASGGNESIDIAFTACRQLQNYTNADLLLDLTPYLEEDPEWKNSVFENMWDAATIDGKIYAIPWQAAYPVMICNNDILKEVGVEMTEEMSYDELMAAAKKIKDAGYAPFGVEGNTAPWVLKQAYLNAFDTEEDVVAFCNGEIPFTDPRVKAAFDKAASGFINNYFYLEEGALAATVDEITSGFANKQIACVFATNSAAKIVLDTSGVENYTIMSIPTFSNTSLHNVMGAPDVFIVPANVKNEKETIEVLKYLTSTEVMQAMVDGGAVVANANVDTSDEFYSMVSKDLDKVHVLDPVHLSDEIADYLNVSALPEYIYNGEAVLEKLDGMLENLK